MSPLSTPMYLKAQHMTSLGTLSNAFSRSTKNKASWNDFNMYGYYTIDYHAKKTELNRCTRLKYVEILLTLTLFIVLIVSIIVVVFAVNVQGIVSKNVFISSI